MTANLTVRRKRWRQFSLQTKSGQGRRGNGRTTLHCGNGAPQQRLIYGNMVGKAGNNQGAARGALAGGTSQRTSRRSVASLQYITSAAK
jgi:hypothetical protein